MRECFRLPGSDENTRAVAPGKASPRKLRRDWNMNRVESRGTWCLGSRHTHKATQDTGHSRHGTLVLSQCPPP